MAEVKGVLVNAMNACLVERYGRSAVDQAVATLSPDDAALVQKRFLDSSFYPYETMIAMRRLARVLAAVKPITGEEIGAFIAQHVFTGVFKTLITSEPARMVEKVGWVKNFFYRDTDQVDAAMTGATSCRLTYRYEKGIKPTRSTCQSLSGFWGRTLELAGAKKVVSTHATCIAEGADHCEFTFSW